jgi:hypothetical protein
VLQIALKAAEQLDLAARIAALEAAREKSSDSLHGGDQ